MSLCLIQVDRHRSESATEGWYVVYLFSAGGDRVYLSLNQGTTTGRGESRTRPARELRERVRWARRVLAPQLAGRTDLLTEIRLDVAPGQLGAGYEIGNVAAFEYRLDELPDEGQLESDLVFLATVLGDLYRTTATSFDVPGELAPEVVDAIALAERAAGRTRRGRGYRLTAAERRAIERRAIDLAVEHLRGLGYTKVTDVGATESYDLDARRGTERLYVEVKGTVSRGDEVILTRNEVALHQREHPNTMLVVVSGISLHRTADPVTASGGHLDAFPAWKPSPEELTALSYAYTIPPRSPSAKIVDQA